MLPRSTLTERIRHACHGISYAALARLTGFHAETIRRYFRGQTPNLRFVAIVAEQLGWSCDWLLLGRGERRAVDVRRGLLAEMSTQELMAELSLRQSGAPPGFTSPEALLSRLNGEVGATGDESISASAS